MGGLASRFASSGACSSAQTRFRRATCAVLRAGGPTPKHIAIVMDGNRRFAKSRSMHRARGHEHGADKLVEVLEWCLALGVEALSVYAFSTDNLKRDEEEVAGLFALAERRLLELAASDVIREKRVRVRVLGEVFSENKANAIPAGLRAAAARVTASTWHHEGPVLNVCFAYTGREDIAQAVGALGAAARAGDLAPNDVTDDALERCLRGAAFDAAKQTSVMSCSRNASKKQTSVSKTEHDRDHRVVRRTALDDVAQRLRCVAWDVDEDRTDDDDDDDDDGFRSESSGIVHSSTLAPRVPPVDLLIRTSGETRLSDFILWGVSKHAVLCFLEVLWPDFSFTDMCHAAWTYQVSARHARAGRRRFRRETREPRNAFGDFGDRESGRESEGSHSAESDSENRNRNPGATGPRRRRGRRGEEAPRGEATAATADGGVAAARNAARARDDSRENVSVAWVDVGKGNGAETGAAYAFVAERNRKIVEETARVAGVAAT